jgi:hypothetical protein
MGNALAGHFVVLSLVVEARQSGAPPTDWAADGGGIGTPRLELSPSDRRDITALAQAMGLGALARVEVRELPNVRAEELSSVRRDPDAPGGYVVRLGAMAGDILSIRIVDGAVEVYDLWSWIVSGAVNECLSRQ